MAFIRLRYVLPLLAAPLLAAAQAPMVYLQFGSFESRAEAEDKLTQVSKAHAGILGALPMTIREVAIAEGLNVYRTQAGPVDTRNSAQSMCAQLASNGDACYIVETAIQQAVPAPAIAKAREAEQEMQQATQDVRQIAKSSSGLKPQLQQELDNATNDLRDSLDAIPAEMAEQAAPIRDIAPKIQQAGNMASRRDASNLQTLAQATGRAPARLEDSYDPNIAFDDAERAAVSSEMEAALAQAATSVPDAQATPPNFQEEEGSFWDAVNPFGSSESSTPAPRAVKAETPTSGRRTISDIVSADEPAAAPVRVAQPSYPLPDESPALQAAIAQVPDIDLNAANQRFAEAAPVDDIAVEAPNPFAMPVPSAEVERRTLPRASIDDIINDNLVGAGSAQMPVDAGLPLPAPPLPRNMAQQHAMSGAPVGTPYAAPSSNGRPSLFGDDAIQTRAVPPAHMPSMVHEGPTTVTAVLPDGGAVQVGEAMRVPLSDDPVEEAMPKRPIVAYSGPSGMFAEDMPSQSQLHKTVWAQLNYFETPQQALGFWDGFRRTHPDFPVVRVRVTSPYSVIASAKTQYSLRIGPFGNGKFIDSLCDSDPVDDEDLECRSMGDLGVSANHQLNADALAGVYRPARYGGVSRGIDALSGFWVQLGAYASMGHAEQRWEDMKKEYGTVLSSMQAQVSTPSLGSQARAVYRLRAGPFVNQKAAEELCGRLQEEQASCLVVAEKQS